MATRLTTGDIVSVSGVYQILGTVYQMTLVKGDRVPPYQGRAVAVVLVVPARHER